MTQTENINTQQLTFNGLSRQAMVIGVPLPALAVCGFVGVMATLLAMPILEGSALFFLLLPLPAVAFMHTICKNDDQALRVILAECRWFLRRRNARLFNNTTTILAIKFGRQQSDYQRFIEESTGRSARIPRLSAENLPTRNR